MQKKHPILVLPTGWGLCAAQPKKTDLFSPYRNSSFNVRPGSIEVRGSKEVANRQDAYLSVYMI